MITVSEYQTQSVGVFGLGKAGEATLASLLAGGAQVYAWDDKYAAPPQGGRGGIYAPPADWPWAELKALVLGPGVPLTHPKPHAAAALAHKHNVPVIGDIELLYRACPDARYVGVTGTNGKSTTTSLIGHILAEAGLKPEVGGNLGTPALALSPLGKGGVYVLELSSYQLDLVKTTRFHVAVFLNITPDHLDRHGSMEGYVAAKMRLFDRQQAQDTAVVAVDDPYVARCSLLVARGVKLVKISAQHALQDAVYVKDGILYDLTSNEQRTTSNDLTSIATLTGQHNWQNAAAAWAAARACGVAPEVIYQAMRSFPGLRHRLQLVATIGGVRFINDSKATNADATSKALAPYDCIYWIAGGKPKAGGIHDLEAYFPKIMHAFLIGEAEEEFAGTLKGRVPFTRCGTLDKAVGAAAKAAFESKRKDAVVLLSPACASFDQFRNFEERGDAFCAMVEKMEGAGFSIQDSGRK